jgi:hypothetical protein
VVGGHDLDRRRVGQQQSTSDNRALVLRWPKCAGLGTRGVWAEAAFDTCPRHSDDMSQRCG